MKTYSKNVTVGDYKFDVSVDRQIAAEGLEKFPDLVEYVLTQQDGVSAIVKATKDKKLGTLLGIDEQAEALVKFAFPKMLKKADAEFGTDNYNRSQEILDYIYENDADDVFITAMFEFILSVFTSETPGKKKKSRVAFKMQ